MMLKMFSVFDMKAQFFGQPFFDQREESATRSFADAVNDGSRQENQWYKHPEDFQLFLVGSFDNESGEVIPCLPKALAMASALHTKFDTSQLDLFKKNGDTKTPVAS